MYFKKHRGGVCMKIKMTTKFKTQHTNSFIIYMGKNHLDLDFHFDESLCRAIQDSEINRNGEFFQDYKFVRTYNRNEN